VAEDSTLCADCLTDPLAWTVTKKEELAQEIEIEGAMAAAIISEKNERITELEYKLMLHRRLLRHIFREYQVLQKIKSVDIWA